MVRGGYGLVFFRDNTGPSVPFANPPFVATYSPNNLTTTLATPLPTPVPSSYTTPTGALRGMALNYRNSFVEQANLNVERQVGSFVASIAYVSGNGDTSCTSRPDRNVAAPSTVTSPSYVTRRPFYALYPGVTSILHDESAGFSNFHSLEMMLQKNAGHGLVINAKLPAWAKALSDVQAFSAGGAGTRARCLHKRQPWSMGRANWTFRIAFAMMLKSRFRLARALAGSKLRSPRAESS